MDTPGQHPNGEPARTGPQERRPSGEQRFATAVRLASLYAIIAGFMVVLGLTLHALEVYPRREAFVLLSSTIVLAGLFWGRWPPLLVSAGGILYIDYFLIKPRMTFAVPSLRQGILLFGLLATGILVAALSARMEPLRQTVRASAERGQLQRRLLGEGTGVAAVLIVALTLHALGAPVGRLMPIAPFYVIVALTALLAGGRAANLAAMASVIVVDYFFLNRLSFSVRGQHDAGLLVGILALAFILGTVSDHRRRARRETRVLAQSEQLQRTLLRVISHDLKTPLTTIMGSLQTLLDVKLDLPEETRRELAAIAYDQAARLNRLVAGILEMTRLEAGAAGVRREPCEVTDIFDEARVQLQETLRGRHIVARLAPSLPKVPGDLVLLSHALANLLHNAAKYSSESTPIEVTAESLDGAVVLSVADRGAGIPVAELDRVFEKFYWLRDPSMNKDRNAGTGVGLAVTKGIVAAHGGRIWAEQRNGGGTIVRVRLPLA